MYMTLEGDFNWLYFYIYTAILSFEIITARLNCVTFFRVIQNIIELKPKPKYIVAVDDSKKTLEDIVKVTLLYIKQNG